MLNVILGGPNDFDARVSLWLLVEHILRDIPEVWADLGDLGLFDLRHIARRVPSARAGLQRMLCERESAFRCPRLKVSTRRTRRAHNARNWQHIAATSPTRRRGEASITFSMYSFQLWLY